ncbi:MAG: M23 family metallopeptidase [Alphaproteobacteria bacterium]|nr:M23 family metallopeptidase [Alphaproteobacteria bacterium]
MAAIKGFLQFLYEIFFPGNEAPNEDIVENEAPQTANEARQTATAAAVRPETSGEIRRIGTLIINAGAIPKWVQFQRQHKGEAVTHQSPVAETVQVTSDFGERHAPIQGASTKHKGVDFGTRGEDASPDIHPSAAGVVLFSGKKQGYGNTVIVGHADGMFTLYAHLTGKNMPDIGVEVSRETVIGEMGHTGTATATHLHYEQRRGAEALAPRIEGVAMHAGMVLAPTADKPSAFAALVNRDAHPQLPVRHAEGQQSPLAFQGKSTTSIGRSGA